MALDTTDIPFTYQVMRRVSKEFETKALTCAPHLYDRSERRVRTATSVDSSSAAAARAVIPNQPVGRRGVNRWVQADQPGAELAHQSRTRPLSGGRADPDARSLRRPHRRRQRAARRPGRERGKLGPADPARDALVDVFGNNVPIGLIAWHRPALPVGRRAQGPSGPDRPSTLGGMSPRACAQTAAHH